MLLHSLSQSCEFRFVVCMLGQFDGAVKCVKTTLGVAQKVYLAHFFCVDALGLDISGEFFGLVLGFDTEIVFLFGLITESADHIVAEICHSILKIIGGIESGQVRLNFAGL